MSDARSVAPEVDVSADHVVVVGYDGWTAPVLDELASTDASVAVVTTDDDAARRLAPRDLGVVDADEFDEAAFYRAGIEAAETVLVATMNDQLNVLAVLTVMSIDDSIGVYTFAGQGQDVAKLEAAGADAVISLGRVVGDLLVEVAVEERAVDDVLAELIEEAA